MKKSTITLNSGPSFLSRLGQSILDAANEAQFLLPYSCRVGRCTSCKCKLLQGNTTTLSPELGLTEEEKRDGWILSCVRSAEEDIFIDVEELPSIEVPDARTWPCRIETLTHVASDVIRVELKLPPTAVFIFIPGQYIDVIGFGGVRRSYSIANSTFAGGILELHIRRTEGGAMSSYWFQVAKQNDLLRLNGPLGTFFLRETAGVDLVFLATGTGIAPVKAMLNSLLKIAPQQAPSSVTVLWGARYPTDLYMDIREIAASWKYVPVCSRGDENWSGARGHVQDVLLQMRPNLENAAVYACGSIAMIRDAKEKLVHSGLSSGRFYSDAFVCSSAA